MHLTPKQRRDNVRGAFTVAGEVGGLHIVLVDDVYTTGATVRECTRVLAAAGAAGVRVATLARTQRSLAAVWDAAVWDGPARQSATVKAASAGEVGGGFWRRRWFGFGKESTNDVG